MAKCKYGIRFLIKNFSHTWKNSVLPQLFLDYKFIEDKCKNLFICLDGISDELHDLEKIISISFCLFIRGMREQEQIIFHLSDFRKQIIDLRVWDLEAARSFSCLSSNIYNVILTYFHH